MSTKFLIKAKDNWIVLNQVDSRHHFTAQDVQRILVVNPDDDVAVSEVNVSTWPSVGCEFYFILSSPNGISVKQGIMTQTLFDSLMGDYSHIFKTYKEAKQKAMSMITALEA